MSWITRYILRQTLAPMIFVAVCFTAAVWLLQSLRLIDLIVNRGLSAGLFADLSLLLLPRLVDVGFSVAVFISLLFTHNPPLIQNGLGGMRAAGLKPAGPVPAGLLS